MEIQAVKLRAFRNYTALDFFPLPGVNVVYGENAQGKTNFLEALFLLAFLKSHRGAKEASLIMEGEAGAYAGALVRRAGMEEKLEVKLRAGEKRKMLLDGVPVERSAEFVGHMRAVMFSPEDLRLIKEGPEGRRRFLDMSISQLYPAYFVDLQRYNSALKQRNALLKSGLPFGPRLLREAEPWDAQLARCGSRIIEKRAAFAALAGAHARALHKEISAGKEGLSIAYRGGPGAEKTREESEALLFASLQDALEEDMRRGFTGTGPHRDDLRVEINGKDARTYASQGQQRSAALSLKLSQICICREQNGEYPILLLDDVLSELDDGRSRLLVESLRLCQSFLSCASLSGLEKSGLRDYTPWLCKEGSIAAGEYRRKGEA